MVISLKGCVGKIDSHICAIVMIFFAVLLLNSKCKQMHLILYSNKVYNHSALRRTIIRLNGDHTQI